LSKQGTKAEQLLYLGRILISASVGLNYGGMVMMMMGWLKWECVIFCQYCEGCMKSRQGYIQFGSKLAFSLEPGKTMEYFHRPDLW